MTVPINLFYSFMYVALPPVRDLCAFDSVSRHLARKGRACLVFRVILHTRRGDLAGSADRIIHRREMRPPPQSRRSPNPRSNNYYYDKFVSMRTRDGIVKKCENVRKLRSRSALHVFDFWLLTLEKKLSQPRLLSVICNNDSFDFSSTKTATRSKTFLRPY